MPQQVLGELKECVEGRRVIEHRDPRSGVSNITRLVGGWAHSFMSFSLGSRPTEETWKKDPSFSHSRGPGSLVAWSRLGTPGSW